MTAHPPIPAADITLRAAGDADALCLSALATQVFLNTYATDGIRPSVAREVREHFSPDVIAALLATPDSRFLVAERAGHMIGFVQLTLGAIHELVPARPAAEVNRLYVQARFAGSGIGKALLGEAEALAAAEGAAVLWLACWAGNPRALAFYARRGYEELGASRYVFENEEYETRIFARGLAGAEAV